MDLKIEKVFTLFNDASREKTHPIAQKAAKEISKREGEKEKIEDLQRRIEEFLERVNRTTSIRMRYDEEIDKVIVSIIEAGTEKVLRQIPTEEFVRFIKMYRKTLAMIFERIV